MLCSSDIKYGDAILAGDSGAVGVQRQVQPMSAQQEIATSLFSHVTKQDISGVYVFLCINCSAVMTDTVVCLALIGLDSFAMFIALHFNLNTTVL
jgi:hypothetical protein